MLGGAQCHGVLNSHTGMGTHRDGHTQPVYLVLIALVTTAHLQRKSGTMQESHSHVHAVFLAAPHTEKDVLSPR